MTHRSDLLTPRRRLLSLFFRHGGTEGDPVGKAAASPLVWILFGTLCGWLDVWSGPSIQFPIAYALPVALAAWYRGLKWAIPLVLVFSSFRFIPIDLERWHDTVALVAINWAIRVFMLTLLAVLVRRMAELASHVTRLEGLLHVCAWCKRIRDDTGDWIPLETYVTRQPQVIQTHGICPECRQAFQQGR